MVHATNNLPCPYVHAPSSCLPQGRYVVYMCPDIIFQILPPPSRPMTSHHVTCHMTAVSYASSSSKRKEKENQYKIRKIKEKKNKIVNIQASYNNQGRHREIVAWTMRTLYKQLVEYYCSSLSSSLVNTQLVFSLDICPLRFIAYATIGHQSSSCHNTKSFTCLCDYWSL